ncbi:MAG: glutathione S-transferase family protein [Sphingobium sp.]
MLTIHHLGISQSDRVVWLCEELGVPYQLVKYERDPNTRLAPETYRALHPAGTAPVIEDQGTILAESGAVIDYIVARHGQGRLTVTPDDPTFATYLYWYHMASGSLMPALMMAMGGGPMSAFGKDRLLRYLDALEQHLGDGQEWLAGPFTIADIMIAFPLSTGRLFGPLDLSPYPAIRAYVNRLLARPAYQRAKAKADPDLVLPST